MTTTTNPETLEQALRRCYGNASKTLYSQAEKALYAVKRYSQDYDPHAPKHPSVYAGLAASAITEAGIRLATTAWYKEGLSPATINKRLNCLSKMGVSVEGMRVKNPKQLKWYLKESDKPKVMEWLNSRANGGFVYQLAAYFVEWTTLTGLRVEESLRLTWADVNAVLDEVSVPGLKTAASQATLPLGIKAVMVLSRMKAHYPHAFPLGRALLFNVRYELLAGIWDEVREHFGWKDDPTATLKALRRSAARYLHVDCGMPLHMVQQYLRHESMDTTLEYLRLTGGYGTEEMRRFLK